MNSTFLKQGTKHDCARPAMRNRYNVWRKPIAKLLQCGYSGSPLALERWTRLAEVMYSGQNQRPLAGLINRQPEGVRNQLRVLGARISSRRTDATALVSIRWQRSGCHRPVFEFVFAQIPVTEVFNSQLVAVFHAELTNGVRSNTSITF